MDPTFRLRLCPRVAGKCSGRRRWEVTVAMAENSPGRSDPLMGGAVTVVVGRGLRLRFVFLGAIVMWTVRVGVEGGGGWSRVCVRKSGSGCCRGPVGVSGGSVVCGRLEKMREWVRHRGATL